MQKNKIVNKHMLSHFDSKDLFVFAICGYGLFLTGQGITQSVQDYIDKESGAKGFIAGFSLLACSLATLMCMYLIGKKKHANKFAAIAAKSYIIEATKDHPEYKDFEEILKNPKAMQDIAAYISNSLRPSERKAVLDIVHAIPEYPTKTELRQALKNINKIVKDHEHVHPELNVYGNMARAHLTYIFQDQNTR